jgi:hypothetical protein
MNRITFPTLFAIAMDYLPIQATSVPCERVFSSSAQTNTKRRNRISPILMESLQVLKFHLKKERLSFTENWETPQQAMERDEAPDDLLCSLLRGNYQDALDRAIVCSEDFFD